MRQAGKKNPQSPRKPQINSVDPVPLFCRVSGIASNYQTAYTFWAFSIVPIAIIGKDPVWPPFLTAPFPSEPFQVEQASPLAHRFRQLCLKTPHLSVVLVNFCQWRNTARLTRLLRNSEVFRTGSAEVVIIDNHSPRTRFEGNCDVH